MTGLSPTGSISFGMAFVSGRSRDPRPAAGMTALRMVVAMRPTPLTGVLVGQFARYRPKLSRGCPEAVRTVPGTPGSMGV
ncbi:hypothetical protein GCM10023082_54790 [Streptomyces tremellae]|uniref:Uncharacterized protein n=1 Tax=Streptomyces tremellae TaxID=1124239 RepID=A0ABP7G111_9ACTN